MSLPVEKFMELTEKKKNETKRAKVRELSQGTDQIGIYK